ncbi:MAG: hypothetical protein K1060chlam2_00069 [Chlamydiae bacterium]|nr:hypothetical protein [Chlamydiota bacterium]
MKRVRPIYLLLFIALFSLTLFPLFHHTAPIDEAELKGKLELCTTEQLQAMDRAGREIEEWNRLLKSGGSHIVKEVLRGEGAFSEMDHYPLKDIYDRETLSQYYYHTHKKGKQGHFHLFLRQREEPDSYVHLLAITMDDEGYPIELFTTNRWVTGESWFPADDVKNMVEDFHIEHSRPSKAVNRWLTAMLLLFRPQILQLIDRRDQTQIEYMQRLSLKENLENRNLEITSKSKISIDLQMRVISELLAERNRFSRDLERNPG